MPGEGLGRLNLVLTSMLNVAVWGAEQFDKPVCRMGRYPTVHTQAVLLALLAVVSPWLEMGHAVRGRPPRPAYVSAQNGIPVLCYHDFQPIAKNDMTNTPENFEAHLRW